MKKHFEIIFVVHTIFPSSKTLPKPLSSLFNYPTNSTMNGSSSSSSSTPNFDNLLLQSLMSRLQLRPNLTPTPPPKSLEELLFSDLLLNLSESDSNSDDEENSSSSYSSKSQLAKEESKLEKEIIRTVLSGEIEKLKPNSGQAITVGEHHICVGFHEETGSDYRVWEWHGHIMLFDEENGYTPEYIYGNYFERLGAAAKKRELEKKKNDDEEKKEKLEEVVVNAGLKDLIERAEQGSGHILHRNLNANSNGSPRF